MNAKIKINILKKGEEVIGFSNGMIAIKKKNGTVDFIRIFEDEYGCMRVEQSPVFSIGYGENVVEARTENGEVLVATF